MASLKTLRKKQFSSPPKSGLLPAMTIRIDDDVYRMLKAHRTDADKSFNDTLRRLFHLPV